MPNVPISFPAQYAPGVAVNFASASGGASTVSHASPLPVVVKDAVAPPPLAGTAAASMLAGPFAPAPSRPVWVTLSGSWSGTVRLLRSSDGGVTRVPVTIGGRPWATFSANVCEPAWEESEADAQLYLDIALNSGTVTYRVSQ